MERFPRVSPHEFLDRNLSGHFWRDKKQPGAPRPPGLDVTGAGLGIRHPRAGRPLADCHRGDIVRQRRSHGKFGHTQSINVPACHALSSNLSLPQHRGCTSGASRPFLFLTDTRKHQSMFCRDPLYVVSPRNSLIRLIRWRQPTELTIIDLAKPFHEDGHQ
jgi:hypothetical protein